MVHKAKLRRKAITLREQFYKYFEILPATTEDLLYEVYHLRYQVYCVETGFERKEACQTVNKYGKQIWLEMDKYDWRSRHYLVRHIRTGLFAATVRLVLPDHNDVEAPFPIEENCVLDYPVRDINIRRHLAEISRFAVSKEFKRRAGERGTLAGVNEKAEVYLSMNPDERRILPHLTLGLLAGILRMTRANNISYWYAVMEPPLLRLLRLFGVRFETIGPDVNYHGLRRPCIAALDTVLPNIRRVNHEAWELITDCGKYAG